MLDALIAGAYTVTPSLAGYSFTPSSRQVAVGPEQVGIDFQATAIAVLTSLTLHPATVRGQQELRGRVRLTMPLPDGGIVPLTSSHPAALPVPASVSIRRGRASARFELRSRRVNSSRQVTITASFGGVTKQVVVTVNP